MNGNAYESGIIFPLLYWMSASASLPCMFHKCSLRAANFLFPDPSLLAKRLAFSILKFAEVFFCLPAVLKEIISSKFHQPFAESRFSRWLVANEGPFSLSSSIVKYLSP